MWRYNEAYPAYSRNDSRRGDRIRRDLSCSDLKLMKTTLIQLRYHPAFRCGRFHCDGGRGGRQRGLERALKGVRARSETYNNDLANLRYAFKSRKFLI